LNHGAAFIITDRLGEELFRTRGATALLSRWFPGHEPDSGRLPTTLLDPLRRLSSLSALVVPYAAHHMGSASSLMVRILPIYRAQGHPWWTWIFREKDTHSLIPPAWQEQLTPREAQIIECVLQRWNNEQISWHLGCAQGIVKKHLQRVLAKLGIDDRPSLVFLASLYQRG